MWSLIKKMFGNQNNKEKWRGEVPVVEKWEEK